MSKVVDSALGRRKIFLLAQGGREKEHDKTVTNNGKNWVQAAANKAAGKIEKVEVKPDLPEFSKLSQALKLILNAEREIALINEKRNRAIQAMIDAGHDVQPVDVKGKLYTFRKRKATGSEVFNYFVEPYQVQAPTVYEID